MTQQISVLICGCRDDKIVLFLMGGRTAWLCVQAPLSEQ